MSMISYIPTEKEYFSIGEVSRITNVKPYILRYWESEFHLVRPSRRESGHRKFNRRDVETISQIRELLYQKRFTIEGAKKFLKQQQKKGPLQLSLELNESPAALEALRHVKKEITDIVRTLKSHQIKKPD